MNLYVIFGQTELGFERGDEPQALDVWDEVCREDNPDGFDDALKKWRENPEYVQVSVVRVRIADFAKVREIFAEVPVAGTVVDSPPANSAPPRTSTVDLYRGRKARLKPEAWARFLREEGSPPGRKQPEKNFVADARGGKVLLAYPFYLFDEDDIELAEWED